MSEETEISKKAEKGDGEKKQQGGAFAEAIVAQTSKITFDASGRFQIDVDCFSHLSSLILILQSVEESEGYTDDDMNGLLKKFEWDVDQYGAASLRNKEFQSGTPDDIRRQLSLPVGDN